MSPRVSVGLPVYNGERFLGEAARSVLAQTFSDWELLISDNGSTDATVEICRQLADEDPRVRYIRHDTNRGASWNFNHVVDESIGDLFVWLAHDDSWEPGFLQTCVDQFDADPTVVLAFSDVVFVDEDSQEIGSKDFPMRTMSESVSKRFRDVLMVWHDCLPVFGVIDADVLRRTAKIRPYAASDHLLLAELSLLGKFAIAPEPLFRSRRHASQSIQTYNIWTDHHAYTRWFESADGRTTTYPQWRQLGVLVAAVARAPIGLVDRVGCLLAIGRWSIRYRTLLYKDLRIGWSRRRTAT